MQARTRELADSNRELQDQISVPTCVLLDINMSQINGFEVARTLAERLKPRALFSLFMLSSSNWSDDVNEAKRIPLIAGFLVKPLTAAVAGTLLFQSNEQSSDAPSN